MNRNFWKEIIPHRRKVRVEFVANSDSAVMFMKLLEHMKHCGNIGHSVGWEIDGEKYFFDGDGADGVYEISGSIDERELERYKKSEEFRKASKATPLSSEDRNENANKAA